MDGMPCLVQTGCRFSTFGSPGRERRGEWQRHGAFSVFVGRRLRRPLVKVFDESQKRRGRNNSPVRSVRVEEGSFPFFVFSTFD